MHSLKAFRSDLEVFIVQLGLNIYLLCLISLKVDVAQSNPLVSYEDMLASDIILPFVVSFRPLGALTQAEILVHLAFSEISIFII